MPRPDADSLKKRYEPKPVTVIKTEGQVCAARFTPCGRQLVSGGYDGLVHRWDAEADGFPALEPLAGHGGWVQAVDCHPTDPLLFSADSWGRLSAWAFAEESPKPAWSIEEAHDGWIRDLAVSPDGKWLATCGRDQVVRTWKTSRGKRLSEATGHDQDVLCLAIHPDGKTLVTGDLAGRVRQWDRRKKKCIREFDATELHSRLRLQDVGGVRVMTFSPDGNQLFVAGTRPKNGGNVQGVPLVLVFDFKSGKPAGQGKSAGRIEPASRIEMGKTSDVYVRDLVFHADGFVIAVTSGNPGTGQLLFRRLDDDDAFYSTNKLSNCHAVSLRPGDRRFAVTTTNRGSNGNGRRLNKEGEYAGNTSPIHVMEFPASETTGPAEDGDGKKPG